MCSERSKYYPHIEGCENKRVSINGSSGADYIINKWKREVARKDKRVLDFMHKEVSKRMNSLTEGEINELAEEYTSKLKEEYQGDWYLAFLVMVMNAGIQKGNTLLELRGKKVHDIKEAELEQVKENIIASTKKYNNAAIVSASSRMRTELDYGYDAKLSNPDFDYDPALIIDEVHRKEISNSYKATAEVSSMNMMNLTMMTVFTMNTVTRFRIITNDPCPVCEALAENTYDVEEAVEYDVSIKKMEEVTGREQASAKRFYAENPYVGMLPVHVNCRCQWSLI